MGISLFSRMPALKYKRDFTHEQRVSFAFANSVDAAKSASSNKGKAASTPAEYKQNQCAATGIQALEAAITAGYKQVFGNIGISDNQRLVSLEAFLCDGRINVQGFMAGLVKSELYKQKFFHAVS